MEHGIAIAPMRCHVEEHSDETSAVAFRLIFLSLSASPSNN